MKRIIVVALAVLGVCMAVTASASAHLFHATLLGGELLGLSTGTQIFKTKAGGAAVECSHAVTLGLVAALLGLHQLVTVNYSGCLEAGIVRIHISSAQYLLSADGLVAIEKTIKILVLGPPLHCSITVPPQSLLGVTYKNSGKNIVEESKVHSIVSTGTGGECGTANTGGTYTGNNEISEDGGTLSWS
jgi:hypothetical protein